ncbi:Ada metal-binding domain-containing protein [Fibrella sp. WM1]|uniref:Ada metal-binding domain-containing protein n=1 Tax=Fibrella musci TaxID=3242485 RepID=UPI003521B6AF
MIRQIDLGTTRMAQLRQLVVLVRQGRLTLGGYGPGNIYGRLNCRAGKRMLSRNRVFFRDSQEAIKAGFRPCAVCMPTDYKAWKANRVAPVRG